MRSLAAAFLPRLAPSIAGVAALCLAGVSHAQVPALGVTGLPAEPLVGEEVCIDLSFSNTAAATGFGPYVVVNSGPFLRWNSLSFVDVPAKVEQLGSFDASGQLINPVTGAVQTVM